MTTKSDSPASECSVGVSGVTHSYGASPVLKNVDFAVAAGEVHSLVGQNGSGKSTLIKIISGAVEPSIGTFMIDGSSAPTSDARATVGRILSVVHQDYNVFPDLTVAANVAVVSGGTFRSRTGSVDWSAASAATARLCDRLGIHLDPQALVRDLGPAEVKLMEIARAMIREPRYLILDEPTASLEPSAARRVLGLVQNLVAQGVGVVFVSHRLDEVLEISSRITVLRDGERVATQPAAEVSAEALADYITGGRAAPVDPHRVEPKIGAAVVKGKDVRLKPGASAFDFQVNAGEILGLTGLMGSGADELVKALGGAQPYSGTIEVSGKPHRRGSVPAALAMGIAYIPEDRGGTGLSVDHSVAQNLTLPSLRSFARCGVLQTRRLHARASELVDRFGIKTPSIHAAVASLSGGNQQKVLIARWLAADASILVVEEPTHGVDIGAKAQIHELLRAFADAGGSVLVASTDLEEVVALCDRVAIMRHGAISGYWTVGEPDSERSHSARLLEELISPDEKVS
jgi:ABC-type sugar transport system ATPase subunit